MATKSMVVECDTGVRRVMSGVPVPRVGPPRVVSQEDLSTGASIALDHRSSSLPASHYYHEYLATESSLMPPCSTWFVDRRGVPSHSVMIVDGGLGLRALAAFSRRGSDARLLTLTLEVRGDWVGDFDDALTVNLTNVAMVVLDLTFDPSLRMLEAFSRALGRNEPQSYGICANTRVNGAVFAFTPKLSSFVQMREEKILREEIHRSSSSSSSSSGEDDGEEMFEVSTPEQLQRDVAQIPVGERYSVRRAAGAPDLFPEGDTDPASIERAHTIISKILNTSTP